MVLFFLLIPRFLVCSLLLLQDVKPAPGGLFSDEEEDIFADTGIKKRSPLDKSKKKAAPKDDFDDDDEFEENDEEEEENEPKEEEKKASHKKMGVSMLPADLMGSNQFRQRQKSMKGRDEEEEEEEEATSAPPPATAPAASESSKGKKKVCFASTSYLDEISLLFSAFSCALHNS